jgi:hypothetical protein
MNKSNLIKRRKELDARREAKSIDGRSIVRQFGTVKDGRAVIATETPIDIYDQTRGWIKQVLLMDGVRFRNDKRQLPIVDSHNDKTVRNVFGSIRNIVIEGDELLGLPDFASDPDSQIVATRYTEGHLNDFSIDAQILERQFVREGQTYTTPRGQVIEGPAEIVTAWEPHNASICATGADPNSTVRRSYDQEERVQRMDESLLATLKGLGLPEGMTDPTQIIIFLAGKAAAQAADESSDAPMEQVESIADKKPEEAMRAEAVAPVEDPEKKVEAEVARQLKAADDRRKTIVAHCTLAKLERSFADALVDDPSVTVEIAQERIIRKMASQPLGGAVEGSHIGFGESEQDKFENAAKAGFTQRCFQGTGKRTAAPKAEGASHFANLGIYRLAEACVRRMGIDPEKHTKKDIARMAMGHAPTLNNVKRGLADVFHTTGSFQNILFDGLNNTLRAAYEEAPYTWSSWVRQRQSVEDFKDIHATQLSEFQNLEVVPEGKEYPEKKLSDRRKTYNIDKFGANFSVTWETIINDNLDALSRIPSMQGVAARRTQEQLVYDTFLSNPTMPDGVVLFSASHVSGRNITSTTPAAPSETTLDEGFELMAKQKGLNGSVLNLVPSVLLVPQRYASTALRITNSLSFAQTNGNEGISSLYGVNGVRPLQVVATALLDNNNATNWYLIASSSVVDTAEIVFLQGEESPVLENEWTMLSDKYDFKIRQSMGCAMIDHVGFYGNRT